jgi:hypothetical protein
METPRVYSFELQQQAKPTVTDYVLDSVVLLGDNTPTK